MKITRSLLFLVTYYIFILVFWCILFVSEQTEGLLNFLFVLVYGFIPLIGGILGILEAKRWGLFKSIMGKAVFFLALGLITWGGGETIWSYYNLVLHVPIPYPSLADVSFIASWPFWTLGVIYLSKATGTKYGLKKPHGKLLLIIIPIIAILLSYYLIVVIARGGSFEFDGDTTKIFFDLAYPIWDAVILAVAILVYGLSFNFLGGRSKWPVIMILFGFVINYFADFAFSYTTTVGTYFNGNWVDLLFATAMFILSCGINSLHIRDS